MDRIAFALLLTLMVACRNSGTETPEARVVAKAGDEALPLATFQRMLIQSPYIKDSAFNAKRTVDNWATESLFYQEAMRKLKEEERRIDEQVNDYRKSLVNFIYETKLVEANLDTVVSNEEIESYYQQHRSSFILKENIVKVDYFKVPAGSIGRDKIVAIIRSSKPRELQQLPVLLAQYAENFFMNDSTWLYIEDLRKEIPQLEDEPDFSFSPGRVMEFTDKDYYYYLKIKDIKTKNAFSPLNFERSNIRKFILNSRKTQLITQYKRELLEKAKKDRKFQVY